MIINRIIAFSLAIALIAVVLTACLDSSGNNNNDSESPQGPDIPESIEDVYQPWIFVIHAESLVVQYLGDDILRFKFGGLSPKMVRFADHPSVDSGTKDTHEMIIDWIDYREGIANSSVELPPEFKQDINLHITFYDPETEEVLNTVVNMKDLAGYIEAPSELTIDGTPGASSSEAPILPEKRYVNVTLAIDSVWGLIWECGKVTADLIAGFPSCAACGSAALPACGVCSLMVRELTNSGPACVKEYCGEFFPHTPLSSCKTWLQCVVSQSDKLIPKNCGSPS